MRWLKYALLMALTLGVVGIAMIFALLPPDIPRLQPIDMVISGVTVINPGLDRLPDQTIVVRDGRIVEVRPQRPSDPTPLCQGCFAIPGLIDAHVHTPPSFVLGNQQLFALMYLAHGVTSIRDVGQSEPGIADFVSKLRTGEMVGPYAYRCGPVLEGDPPAWPVATVIPEDGQDDVKAAELGAAIVNQLADDGVDCIKIYNELGVAAYKAIVSTAKERQIPVIGHVPHKVGLVGVANFEAQHLTGVPYVSRPRPPVGWDIRTEDLLAMTDQQIDEALDVMVQNQISMTPTLANFSLRLIASDGIRFPPTVGASMLPPYWADAWNIIAGHPTGETEISRQLDAAPVMRDIVGRAHERGVDVLAGTDTLMPWVVPGESLLLEIEALRDALGSNEAALAAATVVNARHIAEGEIGLIAVGTRADILLLPNDPTKNLEALRHWQVVIAGGRMFPRALVDEWLDEYQEHFHGWAQANLMTGVIALVADQYGHSSASEE